MKTSKSYQAKRDKLAHWIWGYCVDLPDALVLVSPRHMWDPASDMFDQSKYYVYRDKDFEEIAKDNQGLCSILHSFQVLLNGSECEHEERYQELCAQSAIRDILDRQA